MIGHRGKDTDFPAPEVGVKLTLDRGLQRRVGDYVEESRKVYRVKDMAKVNGNGNGSFTRLLNIKSFDDSLDNGKEGGSAGVTGVKPCWWGALCREAVRME